MEFLFEPNRIYQKNEQGRVVAEVTFPEMADGVVNINHTFVDPSLRGQGVAGALLEAAAKTIRSRGEKAVAACSYAAVWFEKNPAYRDILKG